MLFIGKKNLDFNQMISSNWLKLIVKFAKEVNGLKCNYNAIDFE
jgi:hypothetical protein